LATYAKICGLPDSEIARFERVGALYDLEWIAIYASALTREAVAVKQFANCWSAQLIWRAPSPGCGAGLPARGAGLVTDFRQADWVRAGAELGDVGAVGAG
jgi:hypothetical protein